MEKKNQHNKKANQKTKHMRNKGPVRKNGHNTDPHNNDITLVHITLGGFTTVQSGRGKAVSHISQECPEAELSNAWTIF